MHTVNHDIERLPPELVEEFEDVPAPIAADVSDVDGVTMDHEIAPVYQDATVAGSAVTVDASPGDNLIIHKAITMAQPGDVLVIDGDGYAETAYLGELMAASCQAQGLAGIVIDGAVRDRDGIEELGFPVYATALNPRGPAKHDPGSINVPVTCAGVTVEPGDVVVGDGDGVTVIPAAEAEETLAGARDKLEREAELLERVQEGEYLYEMGGYDGKLADLGVEEVGRES